jgi:hypothetical protein
MDGGGRQISFKLNDVWRDYDDHDEDSAMQQMQRLIFNTVQLHDHRHSRHSLSGFDLSAWEDASWFDKAGMTPLMRASGIGDEAMLAKLIPGATDVNAKDSSGWSALMLAARANCYQCVVMLLRGGSLVNDEDNSGSTSLMAAAMQPEMTDGWVLERLLLQGADPHHANHDGQTALHWAAAACNAESVKLLLNAKAGRFVRDKNGQTPLDLATTAPSLIGTNGQCEETLQLLSSPS